MATLSTTKGIHYPVRLRQSGGSYSIVRKIYCFDSRTGYASVRYENNHIETVPMSELEAIDAEGKYADTTAIVRRMALEIVGDES